MRRLCALIVGLAACRSPDGDPERDVDGVAGDDTGGHDTAAETDDPSRLAGPPGPSHVEVVCGPTDGYALRFLVGLAEEGCGSGFGDAGHIRITLYETGGDPLDPGDFTFVEATGSVWYAGEGSGAEEAGREGSVTVESWDADAVTGRYSVGLDSGYTVVGSFSGPFCDSDPRCG